MPDPRGNAHLVPESEPKKAQVSPTIVIRFDDKGNMALETTPDIDLGRLVLAAWLLTRQANRLADLTAGQQPRNGTIVKPRRLGIVT